MNLLLSAFPPELAGLDAAAPAGWRVAVAGVGAVGAALGTARAIAAARPARVLFIGTCGATDERLAVGEVIAASEAIATSVEELDGHGYRPSLERTRWTATWELPFPAHPVAVVPAITRSERGAAVVARLAPAEHLELGGVLAACAEAGVPAAAALVVSNRAGRRAHEEWKANHARVSAELVARLRAAGVL